VLEQALVLVNCALARLIIHAGNSHEDVAIMKTFPDKLSEPASVLLLCHVFIIPNFWSNQRPMALLSWFADRRSTSFTNVMSSPGNTWEVFTRPLRPPAISKAIAPAHQNPILAGDITRSQSHWGATAEQVNFNQVGATSQHVQPLFFGDIATCAGAFVGGGQHFNDGNHLSRSHFLYLEKETTDT
jgi:hypothetical protein